MTNNEKLDRQTLVAKLPISFRQNIEVFLLRYAADVKKADIAVGRAEFFPECRIAPCGREQFSVEAARENFQLCRIETALDPALPVFFRVYEDGVELAIEPVHVTPSHAFEEAVFGEDADVLRKIGVINAAGLQVEHLGREQRSEADRSRRADDDFGESFSLDVIEHLQNRRETQFLEFILRQFEFANRPKIFDWNIVDLQLASGRDNDQFFSGRGSGRSHFPDGGRDAVDIFEGVREPRALSVLQDRWKLPR